MADEEKLKIGKKGVLAKRAAMDKTGREVQRAGKDIYEEGVRRTTEGVEQMTTAIKETVGKVEGAVKKIESMIGELQSAIQAQVKENEEAVAKIAYGTRAVLSEARKLGKEYKRYIKEDFSGAIREFWYA